MTSDSLDIDGLLATQLSPLRIAGLIILGAAGLVEGTALLVLIATEPEPLPTDTVLSLGAIAVAGLAWTAFAVWRLSRRESLLLRGRVVSSAMATLFTLVATVGGAAIAVGRDERMTALTVVAVGLVASTAAFTLVTRSVASYRHAEARLRELEASVAVG